jgi:hypothetical protein
MLTSITAHLISRSSFGATVPKAALDEHGHLGSNEGQVRATTCSGKRPVNAESQPQRTNG